MTNDERVYHHLYVESKSPLENAERIASLEELVEELQAENAKLRTEFDKMDKWHSAELQAALAENAKLRELVRWMYDLMDESCAVQHPYAPAPISYDRLLQAQARACDLGVEVRHDARTI